MNPKHTAPLPASPGISLVDIYYILFRHKWLITILSIIAIGAAVAVRLMTQVPYQSRAKILIKYIKETKPLSESLADSSLTKLDDRSGNIMNTEIAILTSMDVAQEVAAEIGPAKILGNVKGETNANALLLSAAFMVQNGLVIPQEQFRSDVITLTFSHPDIEMVKPILDKIIEVYKGRHNAIHHPENNEFMTAERDRINGRLTEINTRLSALRTSTGIISTIEDSKKSYNEELSRVQTRLNDAQVEEAGCLARVKQLQRLVPPTLVAAGLSNVIAATNQPKPVPTDKAAEYQRICTQLATDHAEEHRLLGIFTTNSPLVKNQEEQITKSETRKKQMEDDYPGLIALRTAEVRTMPVGGVDPRERLNDEKIKLDALVETIQFLTNELAHIQNLGATIITQEGPLTQLQNEKALLETQLENYTRRLDEDRINNAVGPGNSNIQVIEEPIPPTHDLSKLNRMVWGTLFAGLILAFGLPFLIELYLDRSLKHPVDVQTKLGLPFFISIPQMNGASKPRAVKGAKKMALLPGKTGEAGEPAADGSPAALQTNGGLTLWDDRHNLRPFYETLRDRLMTYFEMINLTHKPKLVAVTSCGAGAGVTSTAAGLASSLSETGDGNVLLVNMNVRDGEAHHFYKGKLTCGLDEVLEKETRESALVHGNLYVAKELENDDKLPRILPKRFSHLLPKMKASDFDYIIFDMPPVSQISITPRLARFMDMVLLVVESGKTDRDAAKRAADLLSESKTNIGVVLNKNRSYLPRRLHHDI